MFKIVTYVWAKHIHCSVKMIIWAMDNLSSGHSQFKGLKHLCEGRMHELVVKYMELWVILVSVVTCRKC